MRRPALALAFVCAAVAPGCVHAPAAPVLQPAASVPVANEGSASAGGVNRGPEAAPATRQGTGETPASVSGNPIGNGSTASSNRVRAATNGSHAASDTVSAADVTAETARMFGAEAPPPAVDSLASAEGPVWDIDVRSYETVTRVEDYVHIFSGRAKSVFEVALQRQTRYGPMIRQRLRDRGLPEDLIYLALVESWFNPHAYSRAAAVGVWQFMAGTARGMGLRVDWWVDERRDPVRSTEAAARLLVGLRDQFGSLYLAAAAYNGGSGRVSRGLARYADALDGVEGEDRFFALAEQSYLRPETRDYVPKIIAAALVGGEPARYGVRVESLPPYAYDSVRAPGGTPLAAVANVLGVTGDEVSELNPHLLRGMTPLGDSMWVRVPTARREGFAERFDALEPEERRAVQRLVTKKGQTMVSIAKAHGITSKQLGWYNPKVVKLKSGALRAGQTILVPRRDVVALAREVPNPSIERYPSRTTAGVTRHTVTRGQTLGAIAQRYHTSVATLKRLNGLKSDNIRVGQRLIVSARAAAPAKRSASKSTVAKKPVAKKPVAKKPAATKSSSGAKKPGAR